MSSGAPGSAVAVHAERLGQAIEADVRWALKDSGKSGGRPAPAQKCVGERGRKFVSLVLESRRGGTISGRDALCYLDTDLRREKELAACCLAGTARRRTAGAP